MKYVENTPFEVVWKQIRECQFGPHYFEKRNRTPSQIYLQETQKPGCHAHIEISEFRLYPEYALSTMEVKLKNKQLQQLWETKLPSLKQTLKESLWIWPLNFMFLYPSWITWESHLTGLLCGLAQKVHPLIEKIENLVREGSPDPNEVQRALREYVRNNALPQNHLTLIEHTILPPLTSITTCTRLKLHSSSQNMIKKI